jgi:hypothetical protein
MTKSVLTTNDYAATNKAIDALQSAGINVQSEDIDEGNVTRLVVDKTQYQKAKETLAAIGFN